MHPRYHSPTQMTLYTTPTLVIQYKEQQIKCSSKSPCFIYCKEESSCQNARIFCPIHQHCIVSCGKSQRACYGATIEAQYSSLFELNDCSTGDDSTCQAMSIYFPPNNFGDKRAILHTGNNFKSDLSFYAVFGWQDIDLSGFTGTINNDLQGVMHCSYGYYETCDMSQNEWSCKDKNSFCINPLNRSLSMFLLSLF